jgi:hypothetical protein
MLKTTATIITLMGRDRHIMAPIVLTALWPPCPLNAAITQTRSLVTKGVGNHRRL